MWVLAGPFDGDTKDEFPEFKRKLLKPNNKYTFGRKEKTDLWVNCSRVSAAHAELSVGPFKGKAVSDISSKPDLFLRSVRDKGKAVVVERDGEKVSVEQGSKYALQPGDIIPIKGKNEIRIEWEPLACYHDSKLNQEKPPVEDCSALGIHLVTSTTEQDDAPTHYISPELRPSSSTAIALASVAALVTPEWLNEVIRLGKLPRKASGEDPSLEYTFRLPPVSNFRPAYGSSVSSDLKNDHFWTRNEARPVLLSGYKALCVTEREPSITNLRTAMRKAGGEFTAFLLGKDAGRAERFRKSLSSLQSKEAEHKLIIADDEDIKTAIGEEEWDELRAVAAEFAFPMHSSAAVVEAIITMNASTLDTLGLTQQGSSQPDAMESSLPDVVPNTHPDEPSLLTETYTASSQPRRRLVRRANSQEPTAPAPSSGGTQEPDPSPPRPRRTLTRRANAVLTGLEDPDTLALHTDPSSAKPSSATMQSGSLIPPTPGRSSRLKRRARAGSASDDEIGMLFTMPKAPEDEPPLKKFKDLFEASDPSKVTDAPYFASGTRETQSQTQPGSSGASQETQVRTRRVLNAVREEEEEGTQTQATEPGVLAGAKRKASAVESAAIEEDGSPAAPPSQVKKRAVEANAIRRSPSVSVASNHAQVPGRSPKKPGAPAGRPDTDAAFLKALASTKRGKRAEDEFDREFNNLRISKPDLDARLEEEEVEWKVLQDFGDDGDLRGNFMTVVEIDVYADRAPFLPVQQRSADPRWAGRPNFKKFKKVARDVQRPKIELVSTTGDGDTWEASQSQNDADFTLPDEEKKPARRGKAPVKRSQPEEVRYVEISDDDEGEAKKMELDEVEEAPQPPPTRARSTRSRSASVQPATRSQSRAGTQSSRAPRKAANQAAPLFLLDSDEDEDEDGSMTLPSTAETLRSRTTAKRKRATQASDSDDDRPARRPATRTRRR
ncbi:hypothetical protein EV121DRAFT_293968 [Schizophyllum commune]